MAEIEKMSLASENTLEAETIRGNTVFLFKK